MQLFHDWLPIVRAMCSNSAEKAIPAPTRVSVLCLSMGCVWVRRIADARLSVFACPRANIVLPVLRNLVVDPRSAWRAGIDLGELVFYSRALTADEIRQFPQREQPFALLRCLSLDL